MPDRNPIKKKYSLETERKEAENILFQQSAIKGITRKERIGTFGLVALNSPY